MTGIVGHEYLGFVVIPTCKDDQHTTTKTFHIFRAAAEIALSVTEGDATSPSHQLGNVTVSCAQRTITLVEGEALQHLIHLNSQNIAERSDAQARVEAEERRLIARDYTKCLESGESCVVGRKATFGPIIGSEALLTSREHFSVIATDTGVILQNISSNGTHVSLAR
jgi:hypothetical protein